MTNIWTSEQQNQALADGWGVFENSDHGYRIERHDDSAKFDCDAAAQAYVAVRAINGDQLAKAAWEEIARQHAVADALGLGEETETERGQILIDVLCLRPVANERGRYHTQWGSKTPLGMFRTIKRLVEEGK